MRSGSARRSWFWPIPAKTASYAAASSWMNNSSPNSCSPAHWRLCAQEKSRWLRLGCCQRTSVRGICRWPWQRLGWRWFRSYFASAGQTYYEGSHLSRDTQIWFFISLSRSCRVIFLESYENVRKTGKTEIPNPTCYGSIGPIWLTK